jgi:ATP synthase protein I
MVPPFSRGASGTVLPAREHVAAMASDEANQAGSSGKDNPSEKELSDRLRQLDQRLGAIKAGEQAEEAKLRKQEDTPSAIGKAMRLSSEFVAGIIAGGLLGWVIDYFAHTSPWGLIIFVMLGFAAGLRNLLRASNMLGKTPDKQK